MIAVATTIAGAHEALELARAHDGVYASLGIHPHNADGDDVDATSSELRELLGHERAVAVGETGLDYFRDYAPQRGPARALRRPARTRRRARACRS